MANRFVSRLSNSAIYGICNNCLKEPPSKINSVACTQIVRWRKRRWAPLARSKMYYVRKPTEQDPEEKEFLFTAYAHYRSDMKTLANHFKTELAAEQAKEVSEEVLAVEQKSWEKLLVLNNKWNEESALLRAERLEKERTDREEVRIAKLLEEEQWKENWKSKAQELVSQGMDQDFIDESNLESRIEEALNQRVNYNFCFDVKGNRFVEQSDGTIKVETEEDDAPTDEHVEAAS